MTHSSGRYRPSGYLSDAGRAPARLTLRPYSPTDPRRIYARSDFAAEHYLCGEPLFGPERPGGTVWTLTEGPARWAKPLACGGLEPQGHGRFGAWLYAADLTPRGWAVIRQAFRAMIAETGARRVEVTVMDEHRRAGGPAARFAAALGLKFEGTMQGYGPDGSDYALFGGVF